MRRGSIHQRGLQAKTLNGVARLLRGIVRVYTNEKHTSFVISDSQVTLCNKLQNKWKVCSFIIRQLILFYNGESGSWRTMDMGRAALTRGWGLGSYSVSSRATLVEPKLSGRFCAEVESKLCAALSISSWVICNASAISRDVLRTKSGSQYLPRPCSTRT